MFKGSMVALVTPMGIQGAVDYDALRELIDWHCKEGTDALVILGSTGEGSTLTEKERSQIIDVTVKRVNGRMPVIAGTGTNCTQTTMELTRQAKALGVNAVLVCTPYYNKPTQAGLIAHFSATAEVGLPVILYNVPSRTAIDLLPETVLKLSLHPNIIAIKEAHSLERMLTLLARCDKKFAVISGGDEEALACIEAGGTGVISVAANVMPRMMHDCMAAALGGDMKKALEYKTVMQPLFDSLFLESNPIPVKYCLNRMSKIPAGLRLPLLGLSSAQQPKVDAMLSNLGLVQTAGVRHG